MIQEFSTILYAALCACFGVSHLLWYGRYTPDDLLDAVELIRVKRENENRAAEGAR